MTTRDPFCTNCDSRMKAPAQACPSCGFATAASGGGEATGAAVNRPPVYISTHDFGRLENLVHTQLASDHPVASFLKTELERAVVRAAPDLPRDAVRMNRRVIYRVEDSERPESRFLVYPRQYHPTGQYLSILSPLGIALLGLREGNGMPFADLAGAQRRVSVEKVV